MNRWTEGDFRAVKLLSMTLKWQIRNTQLSQPTDWAAEDYS